MKKHDEGYALALVLVVLTVICIVALSMMSVSLRNVTRQQVTLKHMEEKYAAQGEIEKVVARLENKLLISNVTGIINVSGDSITQACEVSGEEPVVRYRELEFGNGKITFVLETDMPDSSVEIECVIRITGAKIEEKSQDGNTYYAVTAPAIEYDSYTILYRTNSAPEGGDGE